MAECEPQHEGEEGESAIRCLETCSPDVRTYDVRAVRMHRIRSDLCRLHGFGGLKPVIAVDVGTLGANACVRSLHLMLEALGTACGRPVLLRNLRTTESAGRVPCRRVSVLSLTMHAWTSIEEALLLPLSRALPNNKMQLCTWCGFQNFCVVPASWLLVTIPVHVHVSSVRRVLLRLLSQS